LSSSPDFLKPEYNGHSIVNIPGSVLSLLGGKSGRTIKDDQMSAFRESFENVVLILLDGLGSYQLSFARERLEVPSCEKILQGAVQFSITSVFPSTTSTAMCSLHSGMTPEEHGVIGYTMFFPRLGMIAQMLRFSPIQGGGKSLFEYGIDPETFLGGPTVHERLREEGMSSTVYVPKHIIDSGLSRVTYRGASVVSQNSFADMIIKLRKNIERGGRTPSFHFAYHPSLDTIAHGLGTNSEEYAAELESIFHSVDLQLFQKLERTIQKKTVLIFSGDHGAVTVSNNEILDVTRHPELVNSLRLPPTGDSRASILYSKNGRSEERIRRFFEERFPGKFELMESAEMMRNGYFGLGYPRQDFQDRIGDLVALSKVDNAIDNSLLEPRHEELPGRHGGLSREEMSVPFVISRLAD
jgi:hypothetical protein